MAQPDARSIFVVKIIRITRGNFVPASKRRLRPGAAGEFPFGFAWQPILTAGLLAQPLALRDRILPTHAHDRQRVRIRIGMLRPKFLKFADGHRKFSKRKGRKNFHPVRRAFRIIGKLVTFILTHDKFPGGQFDHLGKIITDGTPALPAFRIRSW